MIGESQASPQPSIKVEAPAMSDVQKMLEIITKLTSVNTLFAKVGSEL